MNKLLIKTKNKSLFILIIDILYCKAAGAYSIIVLKTGEEIVNSTNLLNLTTRLESSAIMCRVSQTYLVNMQHITCIHHNTKEIEFSNNVKLPYTIPLKELECIIMETGLTPIKQE
jgi:DNA-binding LytR/AlgR family response regulator